MKARDLIRELEYSNLDLEVVIYDKKREAVVPIKCVEMQYLVPHYDEEHRPTQYTEKGPEDRYADYVYVFEVK